MNNQDRRCLNTDGKQRLSRRAETLEYLTDIPEEPRLLPDGSSEGRRLRQVALVC